MKLQQLQIDNDNKKSLQDNEAQRELREEEDAMEHRDPLSLVSDQNAEGITEGDQTEAEYTKLSSEIETLQSSLD